ncbi:MAG TPA: N-acetylglucosamine kinase [Bacteroidia bacterium]|nr:N-acetylglucosamine kinase [Bacteroidia bacterium]HNU33023.1 N-acetylglucosamine kinase [Bacteroidia bacterium]
MLLIADSGSTKADWLLSDRKDFKMEFNTVGFNPFFHDEKFIINELTHNRGLMHYAKDVKVLKFYGSGCSHEKRNQIVAGAFRKVFTNANVLVEHDMLGACIAACGNKPGVVCILGTGSNACSYNGKDVVASHHGLGYIIGDEGSGSYFGKKILSHYLYKLLPLELESQLRDQYHLTKESIIESVYHKPDPNVYLASFAKFLSSHKESDYVVNMVRKGFTEFYETTIVVYPESKKHPVHFIGSIAHHFSHILKEVANKNGFSVGKILVKPVEDIMEYFKSNPS